MNRNLSSTDSATGPTGSINPIPSIPSGESPEDSIKIIVQLTQEELKNATAQFQSYLDLKSQRQPLLNQRDSLKAEARELQFKINEINRIEETYDQEYLDRKTNPPRKGVFASLGLRNTQDWVLAMFYFFYGIFTLIFTLYAIRFSVKKTWAALFIVSIMFSIGVFFTMGLVYYG